MTRPYGGFKPCACGCGVLVRRTYVHGHNMQGKRNLGKFNAAATSKWTGYSRSKRVPIVGGCVFAHLGSCSTKRLERMHLDGDTLNNDPSNIAIGCTRHHHLFDRGRINFTSTSMPEERCRPARDGRRRYVAVS